MTPVLMMLREMREFQMVMDDMKKSRPSIPRYSPAGSMEANNAAIEDIKFQSARQDGFDMLYKLLTGKNP